MLGTKEVRAKKHKSEIEIKIHNDLTHCKIKRSKGRKNKKTNS